jgi:hypothetical protein
MRDLQLEEIGIDSNDHGIIDRDELFASDETSDEMPESDDDSVNDDDDDDDDDELADEGDEPEAEIESNE